MSDAAKDVRARVFAENLKRLRVSRGLTQTDLARHMKERGFSFHQQTIQRIEDQERPVRLDEAYAFGEIVHASVDQMSWDQETLLKQAVDELMLGASGMSASMLQASDQWFQRCSALVADVTHLLDSDPESDRIDIGVSLLARVVTAIDAANADLDRAISAAFLEPLRAPSDEIPTSLAEITTAEEAARALLARHSPANKYANVAPAELCELYLAASRN